MWVLVCLMLSQRSLKLSSSIIFSFCCLHWVISTLLSSKSLIHSYVSPNLLLIIVVFHFTYCILQIWLVLIFSSSLLKLSLGSFVLFLYSMNTFMMVSLSSLSDRLLNTISWEFFQDFFYHVVSFGTYYFIFSFCLIISVCLYEIKWNGNTSLSWRHVPV